jgi:predicted kinase
MLWKKAKHVIIDDTNIHPKHTQRVAELVKGIAEVEVIDFMHVDVDTCIARDFKRTNSVGERVIRRMWKEYLGLGKAKIGSRCFLAQSLGL